MKLSHLKKYFSKLWVLSFKIAVNDSLDYLNKSNSLDR